MAEKTLFNEWTDVVSEGRNSLVFQNRNQVYGAFELRRRYNRTVTIALSIAVIAFLFLVSIPKIMELIEGLKKEEVKSIEITSADLTPPPLDDKTPPPPPPPPPPPVEQTIKFTPPVVTDEQVVDPPPVITEDSPKISTETHEKTGDDEIVVPEETNKVVAPVEDQIFLVVEQAADFPGGINEMYKFIQKSVVYPQVEKEAGITGTCYVSFVVEKNGSITDVQVARGVSGGPGCDKEAMRVVKIMPAWKPARQAGHEVRCRFTLPIKFSIK